MIITCFLGGLYYVNGKRVKPFKNDEISGMSSYFKNNWLKQYIYIFVIIFLDATQPINEGDSDDFL